MDFLSTFSINDFFSQIFLYLQTQFLNNQVFVGIIIPAILFGAWYFVRGIPAYLWGIVRRYFITSITIQSTEDMYMYVMLWLYQQKFDTHQKRYFLKSTYNNSVEARRWVGRHDFDASIGSSIDTEIVPPLLFFGPADGTYFFKYRDKRMVMFSEKREPGQNGSNGGGGDFMIFERVTPSD